MSMYEDLKVDEDIWFKPASKASIWCNIDRIKHVTESDGHYEKKKSVALDLIDDGYEVGIEISTKFGYIVDVVGIKEGERVAVEVGVTDEGKLDDLDRIFDDVRHVPYRDNKGKIVKKLTNKVDAGLGHLYVIPKLGGEIAYDYPDDAFIHYSENNDDCLVILCSSRIGKFHRRNVRTSVWDIDLKSLEEYGIENIEDGHEIIDEYEV